MRSYTALLAAAAVLAGACATEKSLVVREYRVESAKIRAGERITLALITDTHSQRFAGHAQRVAGTVRARKPDLILWGGDIIDNKLPFRGAEDLLAEMRGIAPGYYVLGNHEYYLTEFEKALELVRAAGITILQDEVVELTIRGVPLLLAGADDSARTEYYDAAYDALAAAERAFSGLRGEKRVTVLLVHRPDRADAYANYQFDLILSGHTHGGQVRLPGLINGLYAPGQGLFPVRAGGRYQIRDSTLIVSRGMTTRRPFFPRIFNPPELVIVELTGTDGAEGGGKGGGGE
jgi:predicted MPP superfamily phosphohydrolase